MMRKRMLKRDGFSPSALKGLRFAGAGVAGVTFSGTAFAALWQSGFSPTISGGLAAVGGAALAALVLGQRLRLNNGGTGPIIAAAADADPDGRMIVDADGVTVYANDAFANLFPDATLSAIGAVLDGVTAEDDFLRLTAAADGGASVHAEFAVRLPGKDRMWRAVSATPLADWPGHVLWTARDVSARREIMETRREEEKTLEDLIGNMPVGFFSAGPDGRFLYINETLSRWLGIGDDEPVSNLSLADFVAGVIDETDTEGLSGVETEDDQGERMHGELMLRPRSGEPFRAYLRQSAIEDADGELMQSRSVVLRDFTAQSALAGAMRRWERRYRSLFAEAPVGIALVDLSGEVMESNRAFLKMIGLHREAVIGKPLSARIRKEDRPNLEAHLSKVVMGTMPASRVEVRLPGIGEAEIVASVFVSRVEDSLGDVSGLILHFIDTTERKHLEAQFSQAQRIQAVGQLAGGVAHDFNNLLTAMIGFCDLLLGRHGPGDPSFADIMQIKQNANRAANLVRQLLAFSRRQTLQPKVIDITAALSDMSSLLRRLIGENIELKMDHGQDLGLLRVDPAQFDQVIVNLAVNARDAMPGGGVLTFRTRNVTLEESVQRGHDIMDPGDYVLIEVEDTGVGISKEDIGRIFEPFYSTKGVGEGTGLGLSTVYGIVHQTDGYVFVDS
ncbi:MAG: PAS domain-containing protein, partial [Rhodospirillales bacterium]|nr:PAS domain-containing protein [Rhodospirillales bacterium]